MATLSKLARFSCPPAMVLYIALRFFAHSHVADPVWIDGFYDGGDLDGLLDLVRAGYVAPDDTRSPDDRARLVEPLVLPSTVAPPAAPFVRAHGPRAPPLRSLRVIDR